MNTYSLTNGINIQEELNKINTIQLHNGADEITFVIKSYESIKEIFVKKTYLNYFFLPFFLIFKRVLPNSFFFRKIFFFRSKRILSLAEILGRLYYAGFEILDFEVVAMQYKIKAIKVKEPNFNAYNNEGLFIRLERIGRGGKTFNLLKIRTMHPYAEFIQDLLFKINGFSKTGKIENDIRLTRYGKFFRRYYIDELPQLLNFIKGDLKLVGVRPVSLVYYSRLSDDFKSKRMDFKPGCIPPYVSEGLKPSFENAVKSEINYIDKYNKSPFATDIVYFWRAVFNILFKFIRSQ
jgi:lipopolysaccharide/colanic/teichoic acid biosynthesis glycosyltransferase